MDKAVRKLKPQTLKWGQLNYSWVFLCIFNSLQHSGVKVPPMLQYSNDYVVIGFIKHSLYCHLRWSDGGTGTPHELSVSIWYQYDGQVSINVLCVCTVWLCPVIYSNAVIDWRDFFGGKNYVFMSIYSASPAKSSPLNDLRVFLSNTLAFLAWYYSY